MYFAKNTWSRRHNTTLSGGVVPHGIFLAQDASFLYALEIVFFVKKSLSSGHNTTLSDGAVPHDRTTHVGCYIVHLPLGSREMCRHRVEDPQIHAS